MADEKWSNTRQARYEKSGAVKRVQVKFTKVDNDLIEHLASKDNVSGYIKQLIRDDIYRTTVAPIIEKVRLLKRLHYSDEAICTKIGLTKDEFYSYMKQYPAFFMAARDFNVPSKEKEKNEN